MSDLIPAKNLLPSARLSVSKSKTFADCKKKFKYSYILKLPKKEQDFHIYGKFVHRVMELFHLHYIEGGSDAQHVVMGQAFKASLEEFKTQLTKEQKLEAKESCTAYLKRLSEEDPAKVPNIYGAEKDFNIALRDDVTLLGVIDRIQIDHDGIHHVVDYKTTKNKKYLKNDWFQLLAYAYVLHVQDPSITRVRGSYVLIRHGFEYITETFELPEILKIKDKFLAYADGMNEEKLWRANPTILCSWCDFLMECDEGKDIVSQRFPSKVYGEVKW